MRICFFSNECLIDGKGGVQICTNEFLELFRGIDPATTIVSYRTDHRIIPRLRRRIIPSPYQKLISRKDLRICVAQIKSSDPSALLLNNSDSLALAPIFRRLIPNCPLIYLSHGPVVTDEVNIKRLAKPDPKNRSAYTVRPGLVLDQDIYLRNFIDATISISENDDSMEAWLGSPKHMWIPRTINRMPTNHKPTKGRIGCVSTLNHAPNHDGLVQLARSLDTKENVKLRLVGGPEHIGKRLAHNHTCIEYLGRLSDSDLKEEIVTWRAFVNPIFCQARGCSMKVKTSLEIGLPVLTTPIGARGYYWDQCFLPLSNTPDELANYAALIALDDSIYDSSVRGAEEIADIAEAPQRLSSLINDFLQTIVKN